jgi:hypothetical protein
MGIDAIPQLSVIPMFSRSAESTTVLRHRLPDATMARGLDHATAQRKN